jgi:ubiquinone/menaquinone biosynthesis C-methylase UbiE
MRQVQLAILDSLLRIKPPVLTVLDVGCGDGEFTHGIARYLTGARITGIDPLVAEPSDTPTGALQTIPGVQLIQGTVEHLPFADGSFDAVIASQSMHHWMNVQAGIVEVYRVLSAGGQLIIGDPLLKGWLGNRLLGWLTQKLDGGTFADPSELVSIMKAVGFIDIEINLVPKTMQALFLITAKKPAT